MNLNAFVVIRLIVITFGCFALAMAWAPFLIRLLKRYGMGKTIRSAEVAPIAGGLHAHKSGTPVMGGLVVWVTVLVVTLILSSGCAFIDGAWCSWNFLSRSQTLLPIGALLAAAMVGLVDDYLNVKKIGAAGGGLRMRHRLISYSLIALGGAWWFYSKLGWDFIHIPFVGNFEVGWLYIPIFAIVIIATSFSVNETDGLDGLAGGPLMAAFTGYAVIAFAQGKMDLAVFCVAIVGALMAFLWYNVTPASFFMGDTGAMSLGTALGVVAMLTNQPLLLPIIGLPFVLESLSVIIQVASKKIRKKKVFLSAPVHHHLQAIGWKESQIVFRTWLISMFSAGVGVVLALTDRM
ncbi:phospho-N-acetylmuramoyl-pentapeptide-transferase [Candidatus Uhrbacteria bacterium]|nr:phospho-N-acetylmuramoyl-pentapeptide-transferase [Candidatus Uhrbacteria bacterium]